ncbi:uncharacterized protein LOC110030147 [Phalaenopsis equestris]|uniref:uncharacterized protein LOC110030147 n=1 Tax=Phalaenopsis equestris TaxID=78828 RepID=UPI0009E2A3A7|nr:uncharacterized protein LOC110030147 [Phalaenopsis equestris]
MASTKPANWHLLPANLLISIAEKLFIADIIRLRVVCKEWGWSLGWPHKGWPTPPRLRASFIPIPPSVPWMLLPNEEGEDADYCSFLDLSNGQVRRIHPVPEMAGRRCVGASPHLDLELNPRVLNPLTREELPLPSLLSLFPSPTNVRVLRDAFNGSLTGFFDKGANFMGIWHTKEEFRDQCILKIVLTSAPPSGFVGVIYGCNPLKSCLALARVGDASWTPVPISDNHFSKLESVEDIFYQNEMHKLFVVTLSGSVFCCDLHINDWSSGIKMSLASRSLKLRRFASWSDRKPLSACIGFNRHIIFSSGRLLQICRKVDEYDEKEVQRQREGLLVDEEDEDEESDAFPVMAETTRVQITMKQRDGRTSGWILAKASDLDDQAIFVGCNHVFSVPAAGRSGLRKNTVYFTETSRYFLDWRQHVRDAAVFDVETGNFQRFFSLASQVNWPPPVWFMPSRLHFDFLS